MTAALTIGNLELHVAHSCNLACESCSHYSNHRHRGIVGLAEAERWIAPWRHRIEPDEFTLLGGEPTINPDFSEFVPMIRRAWPRARLRLVTNGFLLARHPELPRRLAEAGRARLIVSIHHETPAYLARLAPTLALVERWRGEYGIDIGFYRSTERWTRRYHGHGAAMMPFADGDPRSSWTHCPARYCPQLFEGAVWKCAALAYLRMQDGKFGLHDSWQPYLGYEPLRPDCSDAERDEFFSREDEPQCGMCPAQPEVFALPSPFRNDATRP